MDAQHGGVAANQFVFLHRRTGHTAEHPLVKFCVTRVDRQQQAVGSAAAGHVNGQADHFDQRFKTKLLAVFGAVTGDTGDFGQVDAGLRALLGLRERKAIRLGARKGHREPGKR